MDVGFNGPLKKHVKSKFTSWQIEKYRNIDASGKLPVPSRANIVNWVLYAYEQIKEATIVNTFKSIGFVLRENEETHNDVEMVEGDDSSDDDSTIVSQSIMLYMDRLNIQN